MVSPAFRPLAQHGRLPHPGPLASVLRLLAVALAVVLVSAISVVAIAFARVAAEFNANKVDIGTGGAPPIGAHSGEVNLLLVGSDTRNGQKGHYGGNPGSTLNDVNILIHVSADHAKATVISIPRDLYVDVPACPDPTRPGQRLPAETGVKINTTLEHGGIGCVRDTVTALTGITIPYAALITFDGVVEMSNAVGGVPVCVAKAINDDYTGLHLSAGTHTLQGPTALEFLRTRHGVGDGSDLTRISSQQVFLSALVRKIKSNSTLTDVTKLYGLAKAAANSMVLSSTLANVDTMVSIARAVAPIPLSRFVLVQYPTVVSGDGLTPNTSAAKALIDAVKADKTLRLSTKQKGATDGKGSVVAGAPTAAPSRTPSRSPSASASSGNAVHLPDTVVGQTAAEQTCSVGNSLGTR